MSDADTRQRDLCWLVRERASLQQALTEAQGSCSALAEGRVFIGHKRAELADAESMLEPGTSLNIFRARSAAEVSILGFRDGVVAALKPAGISTQPDHRGTENSLVGLVAQALGKPRDQVMALHRLDRLVSGVVLLAVEAGAHKWVLAARERGVFRRRYLALSLRTPEPRSGEWNAAIGRGQRPGLRRVGGRDSENAVTRYTVFETLAGAASSTTPSLIVAEPQTGRTHQIRVHAAEAKAPLLGDTDYGGASRITLPRGQVVKVDRILLHALLLEVELQGGPVWRVMTDVPSIFSDTWRELGAASDLDTAELAALPWL